jgi:hypothetical protein
VPTGTWRHGSFHIVPRTCVLPGSSLAMDNLRVNGINTLTPAKLAMGLAVAVVGASFACGACGSASSDESSGADDEGEKYDVLTRLLSRAAK